MPIEFLECVGRSSYCGIEIKDSRLDFEGQTVPPWNDAASNKWPALKLDSPRKPSGCGRRQRSRLTDPSARSFYGRPVAAIPVRI